MLTDDRPLDYCTKESKDLAVNLNVPSKKRKELYKEQPSIDGLRNIGNGDMLCVHDKSPEHLLENHLHISSVNRWNPREHEETSTECE